MKVPLGRKAVAPKLRATTAASKETCLITLETGTISRSGRVLNHSCLEHELDGEKQSKKAYRYQQLLLFEALSTTYQQISVPIFRKMLRADIKNVAEVIRVGERSGVRSNL